MDHGPLVVPPGKPASRLEHPLASDSLCPGVVHKGIVETRHAAVELHEDEVLVVPRFGNDRVPGCVARQVLDPVHVRDEQELVGVEGVVQRGARRRTAPVDRVEVVAGGTEVHLGVGIGGLEVERRGVEGDVVVDELPDEGEARKEGWARIEVSVVDDRLILDHRLGESSQELVRRPKRRQLLEHGPEPALDQAILAGQVHPSELATVESRRGLGGPGQRGEPAHHGGRRQRRNAAEEPAPCQRVVMPAERRRLGTVAGRSWSAGCAGAERAGCAGPQRSAMRVAHLTVTFPPPRKPARA